MLNLLATASDSAIIMALIGILGTVVAGLFKLLRDNTKAINAQAKATSAQTAEIAKGNREAKERNGHLGEQNLQITELIMKGNKSMLHAIKNIKVQNVAVQHVDKSHVVDEVVQNEVIRTEIIDKKRG